MAVVLGSDLDKNICSLYQLVEEHELNEKEIKKCLDVFLKDKSDIYIKRLKYKKFLDTTTRKHYLYNYVKFLYELTNLILRNRKVITFRESSVELFTKLINEYGLGL